MPEGVARLPCREARGLIRREGESRPEKFGGGCKLAIPGLDPGIPVLPRRRSLPRSGVGSLPRSGVGSLPRSGVGSLPRSGVGSLPRSGVGVSGGRSAS